jgi:hypothetical protein
MFLELQNKEYLDPETGVKMGVQKSIDPNGQDNWRVWVRGSQSVMRAAETVQDGYATEEEAQGALDELMIEKGAARLQPPTTEEEVSE